jgi:2-methylaconitate cis-trans-isomerase PrpF
MRGAHQSNALLHFPSAAGLPIIGALGKRIDSPGHDKMLRGIPCMLMRGGTSKGLYFLASDLPADTPLRDRVLLAAMGSPDLRQIDGLGGGDDQTSKVIVVAPSARPGIDVEYLFAQVSVARDLVDVTPNSGNMLAGVAPFALERGLVRAADPSTLLRIFDRNTGKIVEARVRTPGGRVSYRGDCAIDGVPGTSAPIELTFIEPAGGMTGRLLPTGSALDVVDGVPVSCLDFANPVVMVRAADVGRSGHEGKAELDADTAWLARLERLRCRAARLMGLGDVAEVGLPKMVMLAAPQTGGTIASRYFASAGCHSAHALTGAVCVAAAINIRGSLAAQLANPAAADIARVVIEHPSGRLDAHCDVAGRTRAGLPVIASASVVTTARPLFTGDVFVRTRVFRGAH